MNKKYLLVLLYLLLNFLISFSHPLLVLLLVFHAAAPHGL